MGRESSPCWRYDLHTQFITPGAESKGQAKAKLLKNVLKIEPWSSQILYKIKSPLCQAAPLACYVFAESRVSKLTIAVWLKGDSSSVQHPILGI